MNKFIRFFLIGIVLVCIVVAMNGFYILPEGRQAVITQFGAPVGEPIVEAGLHIKTPFVQNVQYFEKRILIWDGDPNQIPTNDKTFIFIDATARWRISDALQFLQSVNDVNRAMTILDDVIDGTVRDLVNKNNLAEIIRSSDWNPEESSASGGAGGEKLEPIRFGRDKIVAMIHEEASKVTPKYGIELVDVMFKRVNYIESVRLKVYDRMISERNRIAAGKRALGEGRKAEILGRVDRELKVITSKARKEAEEIRGRADGEAAGIYADAYNKDPEFYAFTKSLESYQKTLGENAKLIMSSNSDFFKFLNSMK